MEDTELRAKLDSIEKKIDAAYETAEKTRKYFLWVLIITLVALFLPLIGLIFAIPQFLSVTNQISSLGI